MKRVIARRVFLTLVACVVFALSQMALAADSAKVSQKAEAKKPADRVVVMYFHRTHRCPTCLRMGSYTEEAVGSRFVKETKAGTVEFHYVDFQDPKNAALAEAYEVGGPTLVVVKVAQNKAVAVKNLKEIWAKNGDKDMFLKYVRDNVVASQKQEPKTARKPKADVEAPDAS